jgi:two-component system, NarL family, sensor kinase
LTKSIFLNDYLDHRDAQTFEPTLLKSIERGRFNATCRIHRNDGALRWLQVDGRFHQPLPRGATLFLGVVADITERKLLEKRADDLSERLLVLQEEERRLIARELHDSTAQHLVAAGLNLMALRTGKKKRSVKNRLWNDVETAIEEALNELRSFCYLMHPPYLDADGFSSTLRRYANGFADRTKIRVSTRLAETAHAPLALKRGLLRIVQEALANVHRHARASSVHIDLRCIAQCVHLSIIDDGVGMAQTGQDTNSDSLPTGVGLQGILARTQHLSGAVRIRSDSHGTTLHVAVPLIGEATQAELLTD